eukprot:11213180-Lingulodinium_polyedra.AAC.2
MLAASALPANAINCAGASGPKSEPRIPHTPPAPVPKHSSLARLDLGPHRNARAPGAHTQADATAETEAPNRTERRPQQ